MHANRIAMHAADRLARASSLAAHQARFSELIGKVHGPTRIKEADALQKAEKDLAQVQRRMQELHQQLPPEYENHGWVWLFLRKPAEAKAAAN